MSVSVGRTSFVALGGLIGMLAAGCSDDAPAVTTSAGATAPISAPAPATAQPVAVTVVSSSYEDGESAYRESRFADAAEIFRSYSERKPANVWGHYMLGMASWKSGDRATAIEAFDRGLTIDSQHVKSLLNSSRVHLELGQADEAVGRSTRAVSIDSTSGEAYRLLGRALHTKGDADGAIDAYRHALTLNERDVWAMNNLGLLYIEQGCEGQALGPLARAVELRSTSPVFLNNLGIALERSGYYQAARETYERVLEADSTYGKASVSLERVTPLVREGEDAGPDLRDLALQFEIQVRTWAEPDAVETTETKDSTER